jgi:hypothetical protein
MAAVRKMAVFWGFFWALKSDGSARTFQSRLLPATSDLFRITCCLLHRPEDGDSMYR